MERLCSALDVAPIARWLGLIPWQAWPQQNRVVPHLIRPAMVTDPSWHAFGEMTDALVVELVQLYGGGAARQRMLSVVMPGATIDPHEDHHLRGWRTRIHVPVTTNPEAWFISGGVLHHLDIGSAYLVDTRIRHAVWNAGPTPRVHLMFDVFR